MLDEDQNAAVHISSALVRTLPERQGEVEQAIAALPCSEIFHAEKGRIIVILEGSSSGAIGSRLAEISLLDGVISANMVYEQIESLNTLGESI